MFKSKRMHLRAEFGLPRQAVARRILEAEQPLLRGLLGHLHHRDDRTAQWGEVLAVKWTASTNLWTLMMEERVTPQVYSVAHMWPPPRIKSVIKKKRLPPNRWHVLQGLDQL